MLRCYERRCSQKRRGSWWQRCSDSIWELVQPTGNHKQEQSGLWLPWVQGCQCWTKFLGAMQWSRRSQSPCDWVQENGADLNHSVSKQTHTQKKTMNECDFLYRLSSTQMMCSPSVSIFRSHLSLPVYEANPCLGVKTCFLNIIKKRPRQNCTRQLYTILFTLSFWFPFWLQTGLHLSKCVYILQFISSMTIFGFPQLFEM